jgi:hypothetical protein
LVGYDDASENDSDDASENDSDNVSENLKHNTIQSDGHTNVVNSVAFSHLITTPIDVKLKEYIEKLNQ